MASPYINLYNKNSSLGRFDLPPFITGYKGGEFRLVFAVIDGAGGNGVIFSAQKQNTGIFDKKDIAIKISKQQDEVRIDRFRNEIRIISELSHENIAAYFDDGDISLGEKFDVPWIAMELCGGNLQKHIENEGVLSTEAIIKIGGQICDALEHFHSKGFVHRDIKPSNFVWGRKNEVVKMIDFGIAKRVGENVAGRPFDSLTKLQEFVGPVFFSSPELIAYSQDNTKTHLVDHRSDIFQLGKVFWYLATGKVTAGIPAKKDCPKLHSLVLDMIQDDPDDRIQTASEVKKVLLTI